MARATGSSRSAARLNGPTGRTESAEPPCSTSRAAAGAVGIRTAANTTPPAVRAAGDEPDRETTATAVRASLRWLAQNNLGKSVEIRVPPYAAVQAMGGLTHTRGTPPNVIETDPDTWLGLVTGTVDWADAIAGGRVTAAAPGPTCRPCCRSATSTADPARDLRRAIRAHSAGPTPADAP